MNKKLIVVYIIIFLMTNVFQVIGKINEINIDLDDQLDQYSTDDADFRLIYSEYSFAQSFKPSLEILTRIELKLSMANYANDYLYISIRNDLNDDDLVQIESYDMTVDKEWIEFDFNDIIVTPGETYFIVCISNTFFGSGLYCWYHSEFGTNPYKLGDTWIFGINGHQYWEKHPLTFDFCFKTYGYTPNQSPNKPDKPSGTNTGKPGISYIYSSSTTDPEGDQIYYKFDWGDGTDSGWLGKYNSGETCEAAHSWESEGTYPVKVIAKDENGEESVWSDSLSVSMPKSKSNKPFGFIFVFGFDVDVKIVQLQPGEDYIDLEVLDKPFYILENEIITRNPGEFIRLHKAKGLFSPSLFFCFGICDDWAIIG